MALFVLTFPALWPLSNKPNFWLLSNKSFLGPLSNNPILWLLSNYVSSTFAFSKYVLFFISERALEP